MTSARIRQKRLLVIDRDLFAGLDVPQREEEHMIVDRFHVSVGLAGVIDVMSSVAAARAVEAPLAVDIADAQVTPPTRALHRFPIRDSFAGVFGDLLATREEPGGKTTVTADRRFADGETWR